MTDEVRRATIRLRRGGDWRVKPEAEQYDGKGFEFVRGWQITDEDSGIYAGEIAWVPTTNGVEIGWFASGDLEFSQ